MTVIGYKKLWDLSYFGYKNLDLTASPGKQFWAQTAVCHTQLTLHRCDRILLSWANVGEQRTARCTHGHVWTGVSFTRMSGVLSVMFNQNCHSCLLTTVRFVEAFMGCVIYLLCWFLIANNKIWLKSAVHEVTTVFVLTICLNFLSFSQWTMNKSLQTRKKYRNRQKKNALKSLLNDENHSAHSKHYPHTKSNKNKTVEHTQSDISLGF